MTLYYIFLFLVPFQEHPLFGAQLFHVAGFPVTPIKLVGIPLVAAALLIPRPRDAAPRSGAGILLLFAAYALFQVLGTTLSSLSFPSTDVSILFSFAILMLATNLLISTQDRLRTTIRAIVLVETFASLWLYKQYYILHWPRPLGPSNDPNYEALSLVMTVPLAIWLARYEVRDWWKWVGRICSPILVFAVFVSQSRGGLLALFVMAVLAWTKSQRKMQLLAGFAAVTVFMFAIAPGPALKRFQQIQFQGDAESGAGGSTEERIELARAGMRMIEAHPVFGVGLGQFPLVEFHYDTELMDYKVAHNTYIQLGAEGGIPTLALYLAILVVTIAACRSAQRLPGVPADFGALAVAFQIALIGTMVAEFFLTAQYIKGVWVSISLAPNLYAICLQASAASGKTVPSLPERARPIVLTPRLRTG